MNNYNNFFVKFNNQNFSDFYNSDTLSDINITLSDNLKTVSLKLHRIVLFANCEFFKGMFSGFNESIQKENIIKVPNIDICCDIIKQMYGISLSEINRDWKYMLRYYKCCDYFMLESNFPENINVSRCEFDELLDLVDEIGYNEKTIKLLAQNMPINYNITNLPSDLLSELLNYTNVNSFIFVKDFSIYLVNNDDIPKHLTNTESTVICYVPNLNRLFFKANNRLNFMDLDTEYIQQINLNNVGIINSMLCDHNTNNLIINYKSRGESIESRIEIFDTDKLKITKTIYKTNKYNINNLCLSKDFSKLAFTLSKTTLNPYTYKEIIHIYNFLTEELCEFPDEFNSKIHCLKFMNNDKDFIYYLKKDYHYQVFTCINNTHHNIFRTENIEYLEIYLDKYILLNTGYSMTIISLDKSCMGKIRDFVGEYIITPNNHVICYGYHTKSLDISQIINNLAENKEIQITSFGSPYYGIKNIFFVNDKNCLKRRIEDYLKSILKTTN
ncbi:putative BTB/POZ domain-containing protein [Acanthamoeba castellanii mimivirus]|uniref:Putative BTB/POZ domain-containing protein L67 n=5 Tax=Mimivirus TaxID=315393 RepID=YL067_MIMIV|nr:putative BTB/POZ domain-containing protein [Acanthamoeba polyphaga mimivirus]Q5UPD8.1 RecName: Full=Putative BTB/POZ domain-containing protein L67 [Acanthamoeba polyphaga mimivirus]AHJ39878.2 putative BTB/POZ domain-containing protein [Samba virus]ALR83581.1 putative BTB/POZ domain-containing protein [Niemeyer virus]AMZ02518.1 putative BTB/POZ domain-containing protein [Mimivirus Bombay]BAV61149.1 putative BTB/POZ domain-containing protein [Acanthamoeba castellanii mimivirus]AAV50342.1 unk